MNSKENKDQTIFDLYNLTFTVLIFLLLIFENFLKVYGEKTEKVIVEWGSLIGL